MNLNRIDRVISLAQPFEARAREVKLTLLDNGFVTGTAATGALRRTSMEPTRALTDLRRPG